MYYSSAIAVKLARWYILDLVVLGGGYFGAGGASSGPPLVVVPSLHLISNCPVAFVHDTFVPDAKARNSCVPSSSSPLCPCS